MTLRPLLVALLLLAQILGAGASLGAEAQPTASDPALEARVQRIAEELRCLVCQNQTIADSNADLAKDLRREVRQMVAAGKSDREVREFMVTRYGDFILYRPPLQASTVLLWLGPFALLLAAVLIYRRIVRHRGAEPASAQLTDEERNRLQALLGPASDTRRR